jgi:hypothetical protein
MASEREKKDNPFSACCLSFPLFHGSATPLAARNEILFFFKNRTSFAFPLFTLSERLFSNADGEEVSSQAFLSERLTPWITQALTILCKEKPERPLLFLSEWLSEHNPNKTKQNKFKPLYTTKADIIFVLGGPGSGKGTQCAKLVREFDVLHISSSDLLRKEIENKTEIGTKCEAIIKFLLSLYHVLLFFQRGRFCPNGNCNRIDWERDSKFHQTKDSS